MCLLIAKPAGISIPKEYLAEGALCNPHGTGVCYATGKKLIIEKNHLWDDSHIVDLMESLHDYPALIHFRLATHGAMNYDNTHPFEIANGWAGAHNGIIDIPIVDKTKSDTRTFFDILQVILADKRIQLDSKSVLKRIGKAVGSYNKIAFLHSSGRMGIANEDSGDWDGGAWYSNYGYLPTKSFVFEPAGTLNPNAEAELVDREFAEQGFSETLSPSIECPDKEYLAQQVSLWEER